MKKITLLVMAILTSISCNALNYYWIGGSENLSDFGNHWSTTSGGGGGTFHTQVPQSTDNVYFDANSFSSPGQTVTIDQTVVICADMDWIGVTHNPTLYGDYTTTITIYGSLKFVTG